MDESTSQLLSAMQAMMNSELSPEQASEAEEYIRTFRTENQKFFMIILLDILAQKEIEEMLAVQCFIYFKLIFTPTRLINSSIIRKEYFCHYQEIHEAMIYTYKRYLFSDSLAIRTNVAASFAMFLSTTSNDNVAMFGELLSIVTRANSEMFDDGLMRLTYESDLLKLFSKRGYDEYLIGLLAISKKYLEMTAKNDDFDFELFMSGLHTYKILIPYLIETFRSNDFEEINYFLSISQELLPKCEINSYTLIFDIYLDITITHYKDSRTFFGQINDIALQGFNTEGDFLEASLLFWKKLAENEFRIIQEKYPIQFNVFAKSDCGPIGLAELESSYQVYKTDPPYLINESLGTVDDIEGKLLDALLTFIRPGDDCPTEYFINNPYMTISFAAASTLIDCIILGPELIEAQIVPRISELISSDSWQDVMAAILTIQAICSNYKWRCLVGPIKDLFDVMIEILGTDIPVLVGSTPIVATTVLHRYPFLKGIEIVAKVLEKFSNPIITSDNAIFAEYMAFLRICALSSVKAQDSEPLIEFFNENVVPLISDPEKIIPISLFLIETVNDVFPAEYSGFLFDIIENEKTSDENLYSISYYTLGALASRYSEFDAEKSLQKCGVLILDIIHDAECEIDVSEILNLTKGLLVILNEPKFEEVISEYKEQIMQIIQKCFQTENPMVLRQAARTLGPFIQRIGEQSMEVEGAIDALLRYLEESADEVREIYESEMIESLCMVYRGLKGDVSTEHFERISAIMTDAYGTPVPSYQMSDEEISYYKRKNTATLRGMRDIIIGMKDGYSNEFVNVIKIILSKYIRFNILKPKLYDDRTLLAAFDFIKTARDRIGTKIAIFAANRHVKALVDAAKTRNNIVLQDIACKLWKYVSK